MSVAKAEGWQKLARAADRALGMKLPEKGKADPLRAANARRRV